HFTSAEALVRIRNKDGSIMMPGEFIPIAEQTNLIVPIGQTVFKKVCNFLATCDIRALGLQYIEVNLSVAQCERQTLSSDFKRIIRETGVNASQLNLEITETASSEARTMLLQNMTELIVEGISFSLDDFGTGQSNLDYMMSMPVSIIKFDRTLVLSYFTKYNAKTIMESIIAMVKKLNLKIVAEGVENADQFKTMEDLGIDYIQGFYFSKPLPTNTFIDFIKKNNEIE
nr:EAL domain-containing protein [Butyrivibrio sp.]